DIVKEFKNISDSNKKIKFEFDMSNNIAMNVVGDKNRIGEVIMNLINNSVKFISKDNGKRSQDGIISIIVEKRTINNNDAIVAKAKETYKEQKEEAIVSIKDNGEGIDLEIYPRLFTKFATKSFQGTGLGLFIAKNIVEAHGGRIWGENNRDGKGATFYFTLPLNN
ncbi:MAG: HAMP domain-containing histidine kinase, partial [Thermoproteota archaeon]|nr:HAMP domain-containing histidine kinase [Thermoproteota archaeon]